MTVEVTRFSFWGRCSNEDRQDPEASRAWQYSRAGQLVAPRGGVIVSEYFDVDKSRSIPPARRPQASHLLAELANPSREFDAVVLGEPQRAFYGNQFGNTFPLFEHYRVPLWVPEVGGPIDPTNEAHDMIMSTFGSFSKGERSWIKTRVRTTMAALAQTQGRYLGGRPPYGYRLIDAGTHPNPAKAADGIPCPSAHDPARNRHRSGIACSKYAVRAILTTPRYTGRQVWNRQRKDEVLIDVNDVTLGHLTKMRWNDADKWKHPSNCCSTINHGHDHRRHRPPPGIIKQVREHLIREQRETLPVQDPVDRARRHPPPRKTRPWTGTDQLALAPDPVSSTTPGEQACNYSNSPETIKKPGGPPRPKNTNYPVRLRLWPPRCGLAWAAWCGQADGHGCCGHGE